jgi:hypothetical protein
MTREQFRECLAILHWSVRDLSELLAVSDREVRRWAVGQNPVPPRIAAWLEAAARWHEANPPPARDG